ncbi:MAG: nitrilase-related carbon-nitrogen hydrolase, partial [Bryobacteraceae bacterium]
RPKSTWGIEICKDMDFPRLSREYGSDGVGLLLVPAWDFRIDGWLHGSMAIMRGVESGFTIARTAKDGLLTVSDNRGRVSAQKSSGAAPFSILAATAPVSHAATLYARWGDWFAWLNIAALIGLLASPAIRRAKHPPGRSS